MKGDFPVASSVTALRTGLVPLPKNQALACLALALALALTQWGCGARQFGGKRRPGGNVSRAGWANVYECNPPMACAAGTVAADGGAVWTSGTINGSTGNAQAQMRPDPAGVSPGCGGGLDANGCCISKAGYPGSCARLRGSVGTPLSHDMNPNATRQIATTGAGFPAGAYAGTAIPGPGGVISGKSNTVGGAPGVRPDEIQNRDQKMIERLDRVP